MSKKIELSVIMSVYNSEDFLYEAIKSILSQSYEQFEFIIINDGSTDLSEDIILKFNDSRIKYIKNNKNEGLIYSLNKGIKLSRGTYIVRMDSDDIAEKNRFEIQLNFLKKYKEIDILGTAYTRFGEGVKRKKIIMPVTEEYLKANILFASPICHPSVFIKKEILDKHRYDLEYKGMEDYKLWIDLLLEKKKIINIKNSLLNYRILKSSVTQTENLKYKERFERFEKLYKYFFEKLNFELTKDEIKLHALLKNKISFINYAKVDIISKYFKYSDSLIYNNKKNMYCDEKILKEFLGKNYIKILIWSRKNIKIKDITSKESILLFVYGVKYYFRKKILNY